MITVLLIAGFIIWSCVSVKTYVVKGQGVVTTENKNNIMTKVSGEITESYLEEGKKVNKGDKLLVFNSPDSKYQVEQADGQIEVYNNRINLLSRAEKEATNGTNTFDKNNVYEAEFYNKLANSYAQMQEYKVDEELLKKQEYTDDQIKQAKEQARVKKDQIYYNTIINFTNEKNQLELERDKLITQKEAVDDSTSEYILYAPSDGIIHLVTEVKSGMVTETRVKYEKITYMKYFLEQIGIELS